MPRGGHNRRTAEEHAANGTYRKDRHAQAKVDLPVALEAVDPSPAVPVSVHEEWKVVTQRLVQLGILIDADLPLLESAFVLLADARYYHSLIDQVRNSLEGLTDEMAEDLPVEKQAAIVRAQAEAIKALVSLNGAHTKALSLFSGIVTRFAISPAERARILHQLPRKPSDDPPKKSVRAILKR